MNTHSAFSNFHASHSDAISQKISCSFVGEFNDQSIITTSITQITCHNSPTNQDILPDSCIALIAELAKGI